ncbi:MAG: DnaJ domain-containing protein [Alphaproteobacteria bacterium]|nr:DnaJ domain-containing protein [Alphaproteobacteria bacterium]
MITKCDHPGCTKAGTCRAPKNRDLREYWHFCPEHAAEYNKNWNYYADMTPEEIEADWERETFGAPLKEKTKSNADTADYIKFLNDFLSGRGQFDYTPPKSKLPTSISGALKTLGLPLTASWREIGTKYRALAKKYHPDTAADKSSAAAEFTKITTAYNTLKKHFNK